MNMAEIKYQKYNIVLAQLFKEALFTANLLNRMNLSRVLKFLLNRGVPLSSRAKTFLSVNSV